MNMTYIVRVDGERFLSTHNVQEAQTITAMCLHNAWEFEGISEEKDTDRERAMTQAFFMWAEVMREQEANGGEVERDGITVELAVLDIRP